LIALAAACQDAAAPSAIKPQTALSTTPENSALDVSAVDDAATPVGGAQNMIAYASDRTGNFDIYLLDVVTGRTHRVTRERASDNSPAWSPDGTKIAFISQRDGPANLYVMTVASGDVTRLSVGGAWEGDPAWSPDGTRIAYTSGSGLGGADVFIRNADGTGPLQNLTNDAAYDTDPTWSPDGTKIAFSSTRGSASGSNVADIYVMSSSGGGAAKRLTSGGGSMPAWSPDGQKITFAAVSGGQWEIFIVNADGTGSPVNLTNGNAGSALAPSWSSDGTKIAFSSRLGGVVGIFIMNADGTGVTRMTRSPNLDVAPSWQP
jgi:Tol biopolymer transport system component